MTLKALILLICLFIGDQPVTKQSTTDDRITIETQDWTVDFRRVGKFQGLTTNWLKGESVWTNIIWGGRLY